LLNLLSNPYTIPYPRDRPTFDEVVAYLEELLAADSRGGGDGGGDEGDAP
jgi:hypothetical protein